MDKIEQRDIRFKAVGAAQLADTLDLSGKQLTLPASIITPDKLSTGGLVWDERGNVTARTQLGYSSTEPAPGYGQPGGGYFGYYYVATALNPTYYYKIATLPSSNDGTLDSILIEGIHNYGWGSLNTFPFSLVIGNRAGFNYKFDSRSRTVGVGILVQSESDGSRSVYAYTLTGQYSYFAFNIINANAGIYVNPVRSTSVPGGTTIFDTSSSNYLIGSTTIKAWANFNGSNGSIRSSYNVSSVTVNFAGNWTINYSTLLPDINYTVLVGCTDDNLATTFGYEMGTYGQYRSTSSTRIYVVNGTNLSAASRSGVYVVII